MKSLARPVTNPSISDRYVGDDFSKEAQRRRAILGSNGLISFSGKASDFTRENESSLVASIQLTNSSNAKKRIVIFPGDLNSVEEIAAVAGISADAIAKDGVVIEDAEHHPVILCVAENLTYLQRFLKRNPTRVVEMQITADTKAQLAHKITFTTISPFDKLGAHSFRPNDYRKASDNDTLMSEIVCGDIQLDDQTVMDVELAANSGITISLFFGAMRNDSKTLSEQAAIALGKE